MSEQVTAGELAGMRARLIKLLPGLNDDAARIDVLAELEKIKATVAATQVQVTADFAASQEASNKALGFEARYARRGIPEQVGPARKISPASAARQVTQARVLTTDMPETFALLRAGEITDWAVSHVISETSHLAADDRRHVDARLAGDLARLAGELARLAARRCGVSPRQAGALARRLAIEADPAGAVKRASNARNDRRVSVRPAPDTMATLSALLPVSRASRRTRRCGGTPTRPWPPVTGARDSRSWLTRSSSVSPGRPPPRPCRRRSGSS